jgi:hypothetical protein
MNDYTAFLESKFKFSQFHGFDVAASEVNPALKPFSRDVVRWALKGGRRALFLSFGLHKSVTQIEIMRLIGTRERGFRLIVLPLGVRQEFKRDAAAFWRSSGDRLLTADELIGYGPDKLGKVFAKRSLETIYDYAEHVRLAEVLDARGALPSTFATMAPASHDSEVWTDVNRMLTLNGEQTRRGLENHICPLQFDIVDRVINRFTNKGELVFDPFGGLATVPLRAIMAGRRGRSAELNGSYFDDSVRHLKAAELQINAPTLFDLEDIAA